MHCACRKGGCTGFKAVLEPYLFILKLFLLVLKIRSHKSPWEDTLLLSTPSCSYIDHVIIMYLEEEEKEESFEKKMFFFSL